MIYGCGPYYYEVKSVREGKTVRQVHIRYIGTSRGGVASSSSERVVPNSKSTATHEPSYPYDPEHKESKYLYASHTGSQQRVWMAPYDYLKFTGRADFKTSPHFDQESYERVKVKLKDEKYLDPPFIELKRIPKASDDIVDKIEYKVGYRWYAVGHEGRHRVLAAKDLGIKQVPVIVYFKDEAGHYTEAPEKIDWLEVSTQSSRPR